MHIPTATYSSGIMNKTLSDVLLEENNQRRGGTMRCSLLTLLLGCCTTVTNTNNKAQVSNRDPTTLHVLHSVYFPCSQQIR